MILRLLIATMLAAALVALACYASASWLARGREWKYASLSSRGTFVTLPSTITWRSSAIHGNTIVATEFSWSSRPFRLS